MQKYSLKAESRKITGRKVKTLRRQGLLPANIYGKKVKSTSIQIEQKEFVKVFEQAGETGIVEIKLDKEIRPALIHNVQIDPVSDLPVHVDFLQVDLKEKVTAEVAVELTGESPAEKQGLGTVVLYIDELEVEALPVDLPEKFVVDVGNLAEVGQTVLVKNLKVEKDKVEIKADPEAIVVKVEPPQKEEVVTPPPVEVAPVAVEPIEGVAPAEEEAKPKEEPQAPKE